MELQQDVVMMKDGKMVVVRHGQTAPLDMVMTLGNGTRVAMDGTVTLPDGTSRILMDGEAITMDGEMTTVADAQQRRDAITGTMEDKKEES